MGATLSHVQSKQLQTDILPVGRASAESNQSMDAGFFGHQQLQLLPGLPNELACQILARVPRSYHSSLVLVCTSWNRLFKSRDFYRLRKQLAVTEEWLYILMKDADDQLVWYAVDPETGRWMRLPPMLNPIEEKLAQAGQVAPQQVSDSPCLQAYGRWIICKIFGNRTRLKGCSAAALDGCLFVVGGCLRAELNSVWRYDACTKEWTSVCAMATPRAFCQTACLYNKLYAVGGLQLGGDDAVYPLQSIEVYDPTTNQWSPVGTFYCARTDVLPATMRAKMPKPMATTVVSYNDQLCLFHSLHSRYVNVRGQLYRPLSHTWSKMPRGMVLGWPAHQSTTQSSAVVNGEIVALDPTSSLDGVSLKLYDSQADEWKILCIKQFPISILDVIHSEYPCLIAGFMSKLYLVLKQSNGDVVALRADLSNFSDCDVRDWKTTAIKKFGSAKPVACQVVDI